MRVVSIGGSGEHGERRSDGKYGLAPGSDFSSVNREKGEGGEGRGPCEDLFVDHDVLHGEDLRLVARKYERVCRVDELAISMGGLPV